MLRKTILVLTSLITLVGITHVTLTPATYEAFTLDALWFIGSGIALILLSFIHFMLLMADQRKMFFIIGHISNGLSVILVGFILSIVFAPHIIFLFALLLIQTLLIILLQLNHHRKPK